MEKVHSLLSSRKTLRQRRPLNNKHARDKKILLVSYLIMVVVVVIRSGDHRVDVSVAGHYGVASSTVLTSAYIAIPITIAIAIPIPVKADVQLVRDILLGIASFLLCPRTQLDQVAQAGLFTSALALQDGFVDVAGYLLAQVWV